MKTIKIMLLLGIALLVIACNNNTTSNSFTGVYVMSFKNEYSNANDTIIIKPYNLTANTYQVERRDGFHRIREGKVLPKEFKQERWIATFNEEKQALQETEFGKQVYINQKAGTLSFGATYRKIN